MTQKVYVNRLDLACYSDGYGDNLAIVEARWVNPKEPDEVRKAQPPDIIMFMSQGQLREFNQLLNSHFAQVKLITPPKAN